MYQIPKLLFVMNYKYDNSTVMCEVVFNKFNRRILNITIFQIVKSPNYKVVKYFNVLAVANV
jgi:hypothetical protein